MTVTTRMTSLVTHPFESLWPVRFPGLVSFSSSLLCLPIPCFLPRSFLFAYSLCAALRGTVRFSSIDFPLFFLFNAFYSHSLTSNLSFNMDSLTTSLPLTGNTNIEVNWVAARVVRFTGVERRAGSALRFSCSNVSGASGTLSLCVSVTCSIHAHTPLRSLLFFVICHQVARHTIDPQNHHHCTQHSTPHPSNHI